MGALRERIEEHIRRYALIEPGGEVCCLVSGGADSTCMWHALGALGYRVSALHVNHGLRGEETEADCAAEGLAFRVDASNAGTKRGLIRDEILPLLRRLHPAVDENLLRALDTRETLPAALSELISSPIGSKRVDLGGGVQAVREYDRLWLEQGPVALAGEVQWGEWRIRSELAGLKVRGWRPGDRLAGRRKKIQDLFVDAKIPRSEREAWPLVVRGDEVVAVPGIVDAPGIEAAREVTG